MAFVLLSFYRNIYLACCVSEHVSTANRGIVFLNYSEADTNQIIKTVEI